MDHIGQGGSIFNNGRNIHDSPDIGSAVAHEHAHTGLLFRHVLFGRINPFLVQLPAPVGQEPTAEGIRSAGAHHRFGDVYGALEGSADKNSRAGCLDGIDRVGPAESVGIQLDAELVGHSLHITGRAQPDGQDHQVEFFLLNSILESRVP